MKKNIILSLCMLLFLTTSAASYIEQLKATYPQADAVYIVLKKTYTLNADGSVDFHYYHQLAYLTPYAFNSLYGESFITYNPDFQTLKIISAETMTPDKRRVPSPANAFNEVLPSAAANAPAYTHLREMVVSHTGLETGAIVLLEYSIHTKPGFYAGLFGNENMMMSSPVQDAQLEIITPADTKLHTASFNISTQPQVATLLNQTKYLWKFSHIASDQSDATVQPSEKPRVVFSTQLLAPQFKPYRKMATTKLSGNAKEWAKTTVTNAMSRKEKALALQKSLVEDMNYYPIPAELVGYKSRKLLDVFMSNGGTEWEKTLLLSSALKSIGINAQPVASMPKWLKNNSEVLNWAMLGHYYVLLNIDGKAMYLSAIDASPIDEAKLLDSNIIIPIK